MPYTDHYEKYLNEIPGNIEKCKETGDRIVFGYTSVSYTHLDVYKRQVHKRKGDKRWRQK